MDLIFFLGNFNSSVLNSNSIFLNNQFQNWIDPMSGMYILQQISIAKLLYCIQAQLMTNIQIITTKTNH